MKLWPMVLLWVSCVPVPQAEFADRIDGDGDGVPVALDCNDSDTDARRGEGGDQSAAVQTLDDRYNDDTFPVSPTCTEVLECGQRLECSMTAGVRNVLPISACVDPERPTRRLRNGDWSNVHRLSVQDGANVRIQLTPSDDGLADVNEVALMVNRGATCAESACILGFPIRTPADDESGLEVPSGDEPPTPVQPFVPEVQFQIDEGEVVYVVVTGPDADYTLDVQCE